MKANNIHNSVIKILNAFIPVLAAFAIGGIAIAFIGENPFTAYSIMIKESLFTPDGFMKTLHMASPLILTGLAIAITFKANIFNMGVEGQVIFGAFFAAVVGFSVELPPALHIPLCLLTGIISGMLFALIPALLKTYFKVNEMVVTLMLNYVAAEIVKFLAQEVFKDPSSGYVSTYSVKQSAMFNKIASSGLTAFFFISVLVFIIILIVMRRSKLGYEIEAIGKNPEFSEACGMRVGRKIIIIMLISGALSGLAGAGFLMSEKFRYTLDFSGNPGLGWDGMLIALLGAHNPIGVIVAAIFYSALKTGTIYVSAFTNIPNEIVGVIQGILILFLSVKFINKNVLRPRVKRFVKENNKEAT